MDACRGSGYAGHAHTTHADRKLGQECLMKPGQVHCLAPGVKRIHRIVKLR